MTRDIVTPGGKYERSIFAAALAASIISRFFEEPGVAQLATWTVHAACASFGPAIVKHPFLQVIPYRMLVPICSLLEYSFHHPCLCMASRQLHVGLFLSLGDVCFRLFLCGSTFGILVVTQIRILDRSREEDMV